MEKTKETTVQINEFKEFVELLPVRDYNMTRRRIINECKITDQIFRNWKNGLSAVPELAKPIINEIAGYEVFNLEGE
ncbi:MAG: hypothetical protein GX102_09870 [Porphyromonadaceae bacterium]|nr:hypothetical protein [Porphyromonadaceae bacterium]